MEAKIRTVNAAHKYDRDNRPYISKKYVNVIIYVKN